MKNKRYRELAAILVMATMAAGPAITVSAEENTEAVSGQAGTDDVEEGTAESAVDASDAHNEDTASKNTASGETASADTASEDTASENTALELTDRFAQQTAIDEALLQEAQNGYSLEDALKIGRAHV